MALPVTIENDALRLLVWPRLGGKVSSAIDKADGFELFFNYPAELPEKSLYGLPYGDAWNAGWDECFPALAPCIYPRHPYEGVNVPDHGELWGLPTTSVPTKDGITTVWHGLRFGYTLSRKLYLEGPSIVAEYSLLNRAPFEFRFIWAGHVLMSLTSPVELDVPGGDWRLSHGIEGPDLQRPFKWPMAAPDANLSLPESLPDKGAWKTYSMAPISQPAIIRYPSRGRRLELVYQSVAGEDRESESLQAYWGCWVSTGGWEAQRHFSLEATTGRYDDLARCIKDRSAGRVGPSARQEWQLRLTVG